MICEDLDRIDIRPLVKMLGHALPEHFVVSGKTFRTTKTTCHYGGDRQWFLCPLCGRKCAILYPIYCRKCIGASYAIERKSPRIRQIEKALKIRGALGQGSGGLYASFPAKPKGMHQRTYDRIRAKAEELENQIYRARGEFLKNYKTMKIECAGDPTQVFDLM